MMIDGIIYNSLDYKEKSALVYLYTNQGLDSILVRGAKDYKKGFLGFCLPYTYVRYLKTNSKLGNLIEYEVIDNFIGIKNSILKTKYAFLVMEFIRQVDDNRTERIFNFLVKVLTAIDKFDNLDEITFIYLCKLLNIFGILPNDLKTSTNSFKQIINEAYNDKDFKLKEFKKEYLIKILKYYDRADFLYLENIKKIFKEYF